MSPLDGARLCRGLSASVRSALESLELSEAKSLCLKRDSPLPSQEGCKDSGRGRTGKCFLQNHLLGTRAGTRTGPGRPQYSLRKPVGIPREKPIVPGYRQPTQVHQRPLHTGHVLSWEGGGGVLASAVLGSWGPGFHLYYLGQRAWLPNPLCPHTLLHPNLTPRPGPFLHETHTYTELSVLRLPETRPFSPGKMARPGLWSSG